MNRILDTMYHFTRLIGKSGMEKLIVTSGNEVIIRAMLV